MCMSIFAASLYTEIQENNHKLHRVDARRLYCALDYRHTRLLAILPRAPPAGETIAGSNFEMLHGGKGANQVPRHEKFMEAMSSLVERLYRAYVCFLTVYHSLVFGLQPDLSYTYRTTNASSSHHARNPTKSQAKGQGAMSPDDPA